jgi:tetratricopeptide (TPR) repeat protein
MMLKAQALNPTAAGQSNLAVLYLFQRRYKDAVPAAEKAAELAGREGSVEYRVWGNLGDAYWLSQAGGDRARDAWRKAAEMAGKRLGQPGGDAIVLSHLAGFESKLGGTKQALEHIEQALRLEPSKAEVRFKAAQVFTRLDRKERALDELARALAAQFPAEEIRQAPELNPLHNDPRYEKLMRGSSSR